MRRWDAGRLVGCTRQFPPIVHTSSGWNPMTLGRRMDSDELASQELVAEPWRHVDNEKALTPAGLLQSGYRQRHIGDALEYRAERDIEADGTDSEDPGLTSPPTGAICVPLRFLSNPWWACLAVLVGGSEELA
jgi:hypothetical protein